MSAVGLTVLSFGLVIVLGDLVVALRRRRHLTNLQHIDRLARKK